LSAGDSVFGTIMDMFAKRAA